MKRYVVPLLLLSGFLCTLWSEEPDMLLESGPAYDVYLFHGKAQIDYEGGSGSKNHGRTPPFTYVGSVTQWAVFENGATVTFRGHEGRVVLLNKDPDEVALPLPNESAGEDLWRYSRSQTADLGVVAGNLYDTVISNRWEVNGVRKGEVEVEEGEEPLKEDTFAGAGILSIRRDTPNYSQETFSENMNAELERIGTVVDDTKEWTFDWLNYEKVRVAAGNLFPGAQEQGKILITRRQRNRHPVEGFANAETNTVQTTVPLYKYATGTPVEGSLYEPPGSVYVNHQCVSGRVYIGNNAYVRVYMRDPADGITLQYPKREGVWRHEESEEIQLLVGTHYASIEGPETNFTVSLYGLANPYEEEPYGVPQGSSTAVALDDLRYAIWERVEGEPPGYSGDDPAPDHYFVEPVVPRAPFVTFAVNADTPSNTVITYAGAERNGTMTYSYSGGAWKSRHQTSDGLNRCIIHKATHSDGLLTVIDETYDENDALTGRVEKEYQNYADDEGHSISLISGWIGSANPIEDEFTYPVVNDWRLKKMTVGTAETRISQFIYNADGLLTSALYPDGNTEAYVYNNHLITQHTRSVKSGSGSGSMVTTYNYAPLEGDSPEITVVPRTVTRKVGNAVVGTSYTVLKSGESQYIVAVSGSPTWNDPANLVTKEFFTQGYSAVVAYPDQLASTSTGPVYNHDEQEFERRWGDPSAGVVDENLTVEKGVRTEHTHNRRYDYPMSSTNYWYEAGSTEFPIEVQKRQHDSRNRVVRTDYLDGSNSTVSYGIHGVQSVTDRNGIVTAHTFNGNSFTTSTVHAGLTVNHALGNLGVVAYSSPAGLEDQSPPVINGFGQLVSRDDPVGRDFGYSRTASGGVITHTTSLPGGATSIRKVHADGSPISVEGSAQHGVNVIHTWGPSGYSLKVRTQYTGNSADYTETYYDMAGRIAKRVSPSPSGTGTVEAEYHYAPGTGLLTHISSTGGLGTAYEYDDMNWVSATAVDVNGNGAVDRSGSDQVTDYANSIEEVAYSGVTRPSRVQEVTLYTDSGSTVIRKTYASLDGLASKTESLDKAGTLGLVTERETVRDAPNARLTTTTVLPDDSTVVTVMENKLLMRHTHTGVSDVSYSYGPYDRLESVSDAGTGATVYTYHPDGSVKDITTPNPGGVGGEGPHTIQYLISGIGGLGYTGSGGMQRRVTSNCNKVTLHEHYPTGEVARISGDVQYPQEYTYDYAGRRKTLKTFRVAGNPATAATTSWSYNSAGFMTRKDYPGGDSLKYSYWPHGGVNVETMSRNGLSKTHSYNALQLLSGVDYSDTTPDVSFSYDRLGRQTQVTDAAGTRILSYSSNLLLDFQEYTLGPLAGIKLDYSYDDLRRRTDLNITEGSNVLYATGRRYGSASRITKIIGHGLTHELSYENNRPVVNQIFNDHFTIVVDFDNFLRPRSIITHKAGETLSSSTYTHNDCGLRETHTYHTGDKWTYTYDDFHQLKTAVKRDALGAVIPGCEYAYNFDDIGNPRGITQNQNETELFVNRDNQLTRVNFPHQVDITGRVCTPPTTEVLVNGQVANLTPSGFWHREITTNQVLTPVEVLARDDSGNAALESGFLFRPQALVEVEHDDDGNQTQDEQWVMEWDGENRLVRQTSRQDVGLAPFMQSDQVYTYDAGGRRIRKETTANGETRERLYVYDGWNLVLELDGNQQPVSSHVWGLDKTMTPQEGGGVGGLLTSTLSDHPNEVYAPLYDGNGNILGYVETDTGVEVAKYDYSPFGETKGIYGSLARDLPFRFSSKYLDEETNQLYYGYRYYKPTSGRWLSRDPIQERGGKNVYGFAGNNPVNYFDRTGKDYMQVTLWDPRSGSIPTYITPNQYAGNHFMGGDSVSTVRIVRDRGDGVFKLHRPRIKNIGFSYDQHERLATAFNRRNHHNWYAHNNDVKPHVVNIYSVQQTGGVRYYIDAEGTIRFPGSSIGDVSLGGGAQANVWEYVFIYDSIQGMKNLFGNNAGTLGPVASTAGIDGQDMAAAINGAKAWLTSPMGRAWANENKEEIAGISAGVAATYYLYKKAGPSVLRAFLRGKRNAPNTGGKPPFALGLTDEGLESFAQARGAQTWKDLPDPDKWKSGVRDALADPDVPVLFNLDGVDAWGGAARAAGGRGGPTDWELLQIQQNPQWWDSVQFWKDGAPAANPFQ